VECVLEECDLYGCRFDANGDVAACDEADTSVDGDIAFED
jgi:hypothetical protein